MLQCLREEGLSSLQGLVQSGHTARLSALETQAASETYETKEEHAEGLHETTPHERDTTAQRVCQEEDENEAGDHFDDPIDPLSKERSCSAGQPEILEYSGSVVVDGTGLQAC